MSLPVYIVFLVISITQLMNEILLELFASRLIDIVVSWLSVSIIPLAFNRWCHQSDTVSVVCLFYIGVHDILVNYLW